MKLLNSVTQRVEVVDTNWVIYNLKQLFARKADFSAFFSSKILQPGISAYYLNTLDSKLTIQFGVKYFVLDYKCGDAYPKVVTDHLHKLRRLVVHDRYYYEWFNANRQTYITRPFAHKIKNLKYRLAPKDGWLTRLLS